MPVQPSDDELKAALVALRADNPVLGISKIHALLLTAHPAWTVSEKRTRKALQALGLMLGGNATTTTTGPSFRPTKGLQVSQWTKKAVVHDFGAGRGKGLVAATDGDDTSTSPSPAITSGEVIWKEDPWAIAPEWRARLHSDITLTNAPPLGRDIFDLQWSTPSRACAHCTTPFAQGTAAATLVASCPGLSTSSSSSSSSGVHCPARFCHRLCLARAQATHHPLLCPAQNPGGARLVRWARRCEWLALHALARVVARVLLGYQRGAGAKAQEMDEMDVVRGWAALGMEDRVKSGA